MDGANKGRPMPIIGQSQILDDDDDDNPALVFRWNIGRGDINIYSASSLFLKLGTSGCINFAVTENITVAI